MPIVGLVLIPPGRCANRLTNKIMDIDPRREILITEDNIVYVYDIVIIFMVLLQMLR